VTCFQSVRQVTRGRNKGPPPAGRPRCAKQIGEPDAPERGFWLPPRADALQGRILLPPPGMTG